MIYRLSSRTILLAALSMVASFASADVHYNARTSDYQINYSNLSFGSASAQYDITAMVSADAKGDSNIQTPITVRTLATNVTSFGTGGSTFSYNSAASSATTTFSGNELTGVDHLNYKTALGTNFTDSYLVAGVTNGLHTLEFNGGGFGFLDNGKTFTLNVNLQGNWTHLGTTTGHLQLIGFDSSWSAPTFTFSGGETHITMVNTDYNNAADTSPNLDFKLYGTKAVPEPAAWAAISFGVVGLGFGRRRKNRLAS
jgi:hypothetical protein